MTTVVCLCCKKETGKTIAAAIIIVLLTLSILISVAALVISLWVLFQDCGPCRGEITSAPVVDIDPVTGALVNATEYVNALTSEINEIQRTVTEIRLEQRNLNSIVSQCGTTFWEQISYLNLSYSSQVECSSSEGMEYLNGQIRACGRLANEVTCASGDVEYTTGSGDVEYTTGSGVMTMSSECSGDPSNGAISFYLNEEKITKYVLSAQWARQFIHVNTTSITLQGGGRVYIGDVPSDIITPESFYQINLLGKTLVFDVDLSNVGCSCNGALYLVNMPAYGPKQQPAPGANGDFYCDANAVGGTYCPEMDVMESNKFAMASTAHTCQLLPPHFYPSCDHAGCGTNILDVDINEFGPGKRIDTNKPFTLSVSFVTGENSTLIEIMNYFFQDGNTFEFNACQPDYLQRMSESLKGIVMTMSLWGTGPGGMSWLDGKSGCQGGCNIAASSVTFSNFKIHDL